MSQGYSADVWDAVKAMWMAGESASSIGQKDGMPSKQAICVRAKDEGWQRIDAIDEGMEIIPFDGLSDTQRIAVTEIARGMPYKDAAARAGVHPTTISDWIKHDPNFAKAKAAAVWVKNSRRIAKVEGSEDPRMAIWLLERDKDSREDFAPKYTQAPAMNFNILGQVQVGIPRIEQEQEAITHEPA
jgi:hypothetical protein